jgi:hypothetical protein
MIRRGCQPGPGGANRCISLEATGRPFIIHPGLRRDRDMAADQGLQPGPLGQRHHRDKPAPGHEIRVVEGRGNPQRIVRQLHLQGALLNWLTGAQVTPIVSVQGHFS